MEYFKAYNLIADQDKTLVQVRSYLLCHSFELSMKALLRASGCTVRQLQDFSHDLKALATELEDNARTKVTWTDKENEIIEIANYHYKTKELEYSAKGFKMVVDVDQFSQFLSAWLQKSRGRIVDSIPRN